MQQRKLSYKRTGFIETDFPYRHIMGLHKPLEVLPQASDASYSIEPYDQFQTSSCTGNAACRAKRILVKRYGIEENPSRKFHYNCEEIEDGDHNGDNGSSLRTSMDVLLNKGVCDESLMPFGDGSDIIAAPTKAMYADAAKYKIGAFYAIQNEYQMKHCLAHKFPVVFGIDCPQQLMADDFNGVLENLLLSDKIIEDGQPAGHALCIDGYDGEYFWITNSWGSDWGPFKGRFKIHSSVMFDPNWCSDFFTPRLAHEPGV